MYLLIALSSKCSLNARIKDYVQLILQLYFSDKQFIKYFKIHYHYYILMHITTLF